MRISIALIVTALFCTVHPALAATDPLKEGPFPVGVITTVFVDNDRTDHFTQKPRTLVTEIWYPAADSARIMPKSKYTDFIPGGVTPDLEEYYKKARGKTTDELNKTYWMNSCRDAPVRLGRYPVIIFSHGNGGSRHQNTFWCDYVASHGYVIVSADHTGNAGMTFLEEGRVPMQASERANSAVDRPKDMMFLLDQMVKWNDGADERFKGKLDLSRPCAAGMSFGSMTAVRVADMDARFKSVIAMSGAYPQHSNLKAPTLWMLGTEDRTIGASGNAIIRSLHEKHEGPSYLLELKNGGHYSFTDMAKVNPTFGDGVGKGARREGGAEFSFTSMATTYKIINAYSTAFLAVYVKGDKSSMPFLRKNGWPEEIIWQDRNVQEPSDSVGPDAWQLRGEANFKAGKIAESIQDFDRVLSLAPGRKPYHWQRGISLYYAGRYVEAKQQFELHQTVNSNDVENAVWHFLCTARADGLEAARKSLIPIENDARVPMAQVHQLFAGKASPDDVLAAARSAPAQTRSGEPMFYANLYLGLYYEAVGDGKKAREYIIKAAERSKENGYMGDVARIHAGILKTTNKQDSVAQASTLVRRFPATSVRR